MHSFSNFYLWTHDPFEFFTRTTLPLCSVKEIAVSWKSDVMGKILISHADSRDLKTFHLKWIVKLKRLRNVVEDRAAYRRALVWNQWHGTVLTGQYFTDASWSLSSGWRPDTSILIVQHKVMYQLPDRCSELNSSFLFCETGSQKIQMPPFLIRFSLTEYCAPPR